MLPLSVLNATATAFTESCNMYKVGGKLYRPVPTKADGSCLIWSAFGHDADADAHRAHMEGFARCELVGTRYTCYRAVFDRHVKANFEGLVLCRYYQHLRSESDASLAGMDMMDYMLDSIGRIREKGYFLNYYLLDMEPGTYTMVTEDTVNSRHSITPLGQGMEGTVERVILFQPRGSHFSAMEEVVSGKRRREPAFAVPFATWINDDRNWDKIERCVDVILKMDYNVAIEGGEVCTCTGGDGDGDGDCRVSQHFAVRPSWSKEDISAVFLMVGDGQLSKTRHALGHAVLLFLKHGVLPVVTVRTRLPDVKRWTASIDSYNERLREASDGLVYLRPYVTEQGVLQHIEDDGKGIPILVVLYHKQGVQVIQNLVKGLPGVGVSTLPETGHFPIHIVADECDTQIRNPRASSVAETEMFRRIVVLDDGTDEEADDDEVCEKSMSLFKGAAAITWITATPGANLANDVLGWRGGVLVAVQLEMVPEYYAYDTQVLGHLGRKVHDSRIIKYGTADNAYQVIGNMASTSRVRRGIFTSNTLRADKIGMKKMAEHAATMYGPAHNPFNKAIVSAAWVAEYVNIFVGGEGARAHRYAEAIRKLRGGLGFAVKDDDENVADGVTAAFRLTGNIVDFYDLVFMAQALITVDETSTTIADKTARLLDLPVSDVEDMGPDIVVVTGMMGERGATFKTSHHRWELTDMYMMGKLSQWHIEGIDQTAFRLCGVSRLTVTKTFWSTPNFRRYLRLCLYVNAVICNAVTEGKLGDDGASLLEYLEHVKESAINIIEKDDGELDVDYGQLNTLLFLPPRRGIQGRQARLSRTAACSKVTSLSKDAGDEMKVALARVQKTDAHIEFFLPDVSAVEVGERALHLPAGGVGPEAMGAERPVSTDVFAAVWRADSTRAMVEGILRVHPDQLCAQHQLVNALFERGIDIPSRGNRPTLRRISAFVAYGKKLQPPLDWLGDKESGLGTVYYGHRHWGLRRGTGEEITAEQVDYRREVLEEIGQIPVGEEFNRKDILASLRRRFPGRTATQYNRWMTNFIEKGNGHEYVKAVGESRAGRYVVLRH